MQIIQHELFPDSTGISKELLCDLISDGSRLPVKLTITANRVAMASIAFTPGGLAKVRLHEAFLNAPHAVVEAIGQYIRSRRAEDWAPVADYAKAIVSGKKRPARRMKPETVGAVYDLKEVKNDVNKSFFNGRVSCGIEWARGRPAKRPGTRSRSIRFGSWDADEETVRISPLLDDVRVPYDFIRYIVFHEMLHAVVPCANHGGRRSYHPPTFRILERSYPDVKRMHGLAKDLVKTLT
jgi:hypothetical protein